MYACCLAAGAESLAIGGRRGCRALNPLRDVDPVRAAAVRPYVLRTVDWSLAVADYLPRARRCLGAVPRRVSVRGESTFSSCARWGSLCLLTLQWCSPCDGPRPPPHHPGAMCHGGGFYAAIPADGAPQLEITTGTLWRLVQTRIRHNSTTSHAPPMRPNGEPPKNTNTPRAGSGALGDE